MEKTLSPEDFLQIETNLQLQGKDLYLPANSLPALRGMLTENSGIIIHI